MTDIILVFKALQFAAERHRHQFRKGEEKVPYINHPIGVASLLAQNGENDPVLLSAAILHDVIEDTVEDEKEKQDLIEEIKKNFGEEVLLLTLEVTDDKSLAKEERKKRQVIDAPSKSVKAKKLRIADKITNLRDIYNDPPTWWNRQRIIEYHNWAEEVVAGLRGVNEGLEKTFDEVLQAGRSRYQKR